MRGVGHSIYGFRTLFGLEMKIHPTKVFDFNSDLELGAFAI